MSRVDVDPVKPDRKRLARFVAPVMGVLVLASCGHGEKRIPRGVYACTRWTVSTALTVADVQKNGISVKGNPDAKGDAVNSKYRAIIAFPHQKGRAEGIAFVTAGDNAVNVTELIAPQEPPNFTPDMEVNMGLGNGAVTFAGVTFDGEKPAPLPTHLVGEYDETAKRPRVPAQLQDFPSC